MPFNHVMVDLETLSTRVDACIIQIAAVAFDPETGELGPRFNAYVNETCLIGARVGHIDVNTVAFWMSQKVSAAMGAAVGSEDTGLYLSEALGSFAEWLQEEVEHDGEVALEGLWSHGATFDIPILQDAFERRCPEVCEGKVPWHYRTPRDTRTLFALAPGGMPRPPKDETREHDARYDCEYQIAQVVEALRNLRK